ncbi:hypothetical protein C8Q74DRAFT_130384 [Fomes fomentarius]|nr:hypothetical protein C8Q74DRAFT_130384 [Fomes fomentarius]
MVRRSTRLASTARQRSAPRQLSTSSSETPPPERDRKAMNRDAIGRLKLSKEAYALLRDREQRDALLRKVVKLPGCEEYTSQKLRVYFKTRRKDQGRAVRALEEKAASKSLPKRRVTSTKRSRVRQVTPIQTISMTNSRQTRIRASHGL